MRTNGFELYGRRSPRRSISPAARRHARASACSQFIRADQRGHWPWPWRRLSGSMLRIGAERPFCTWLATHARAADTFRAAQAHGSVRAWVWATERARWPALTRSTGRSLIVVWSSPHAAGPSRRRSARALGTARRRPLPAELEQAASATSGPIARSAQGAVWQW